MASAADTSPTEPAYERDPRLLVLATEVVAIGEDGGRPFAVLRDTILYPEGGGQPADRGLIAGVPVLDVQKHDGVIRHTLERALVPGPVHVELDWARRFDHMQQHTGQHLLSAIAEDRFGLKTTSFHLGEDTCDVELDAAGIAPPRLQALADAIAAEIRAARPVRPRHVSVAEYEALPAVRSRGLPPGHAGPVRLVTIEGVDLNTCGGTHLASTSEIELVHLIGTEPVRGGTRVYFVAGSRARRRMAELEARQAELRRVLGVGDRDLVAAATGRLAELRESASRERMLAAGLAEATAASLGACAEPLVDAHFEALDAVFIQQVARALAKLAPGKVGLFTAGPAGAGAFAIAAGAKTGVDLKAVGPRVAEALGGRGGGARDVFQGKCPTPAAHASAIEILRAALPRAT